MAEPAEGIVATFSIGHVLQRTFTAFFRGFTHFMPLGLVCYLPAAFIFYIQASKFTVVRQPGATPEQMAEAMRIDPFMMVLGFLLPMICGSVFAAIAIYEVVLDEAGARPSIGHAISATLPRVLPVLLASILFTIIVYAGFILLILPGLFLLTILWVTIPVVIMERANPFTALKRSAQLTKGFRWRVLGLVLVFFLILAGVQMAMSIPAILIQAIAQDPLLVTLLNYVSYAIFGILSSLAVAYSYVQLKLAKEGTDVKQLASIFS